jgi:peptidoglycan LD-endopeptidase LytH
VVRPRIIASFALGFAAGMLTLTVVMLVWGDLKRLNGLAEVSASGAVATATVTSPPPARAPEAVQETDLPPGDSALAMPIAGIDPQKLTSNFSDARGGHTHEALDIMAPRGTPVMAVDQGNVAKLFISREGGLTVYQFDDARELCYYYAHLDRYAPGLKEGTLLRRGDVLGYVGSSGNAPPNAPHLHFAVFRLGPEKAWWKGTAIDPLPLLRGR